MQLATLALSTSGLIYNPTTYSYNATSSAQVTNVIGGAPWIACNFTASEVVGSSYPCSFNTTVKIPNNITVLLYAVGDATVRATTYNISIAKSSPSADKSKYIFIGASVGGGLVLVIIVVVAVSLYLKKRAKTSYNINSGSDSDPLFDLNRNR